MILPIYYFIQKNIFGWGSESESGSESRSVHNEMDKTHHGKPKPKYIYTISYRKSGTK
jgi:hypothetical protein